VHEVFKFIRELDSGGDRDFFDERVRNIQVINSNPRYTATKHGQTNRD
jgi:hypothetical protein